MSEDNMKAQHRIWHESTHASFRVLGMHLRRLQFFKPLARLCTIEGKNQA
jgi:hypothetical protein